MDSQKYSDKAESGAKLWLAIRIIGILLTGAVLVGWGYLTLLTGVVAWLAGVLVEPLSIIWLLFSVTLWGGAVAVLFLLVRSLVRQYRD